MMQSTFRGTLGVKGGLWEKVNADPLLALVGSTMVAIERSSLPEGIQDGDEVVVVPTKRGTHQITGFFHIAARHQ